VRIVHIITALRAEGAQIMLYKLLSRMQRGQFESVVVSLSDRGEMAERFATLDVPVHSIDMKAGRPTPAAVWRLIHCVRQIGPDLIQGWMYHGNLAAQLASAFAPVRVPVLWNIRGSHYNLKDEKLATAAVIWLGAKLSRLPVKIINNSSASARGHEEQLCYNAGKITIIPNGFDTDLFSPSRQARINLRDELKLSHDTLLIGLIARFHPVKDHANFLRAATLLLKSHRQVQFVLAGSGMVESNKALRAMIDVSDISKHVHLLGERSDVHRLLAAMDIVSLSSTSEGFPNVLGEAMACGVPCVSTDVGDSAVLIGDTGVIVPPRDPEALAGAWQHLVEMTDEQRSQLGQRARQHIEANFSLDSVVNTYAALYEQVYFSESGGAKN
jgi:glycosyltransferase involved in cell wall biosynthesis